MVSEHIRQLCRLSSVERPEPHRLCPTLARDVNQLLAVHRQARPIPGGCSELHHIPPVPIHARDASPGLSALENTIVCPSAVARGEDALAISSSGFD